MKDTHLKYIMSDGDTTNLKSKVFCAFHPNNSKSAERIINDVISAHKCTVFYYENGSPLGTAENDEDELSRMSLFIIVVSSDYLYTPSFAKDVIYKFAVEHKIPVLPIMIENGLEKPFNELMGTLQFLLLNNEKYDITAVPYFEKLKNYLSNTLTTGEEKKSLREAFDTSLFLSYRKKDRRYAQELMKAIHDDESCHGISIWYDEFLVPGENFNSGIRDELENSEAVILVVTPHITEKDNYIILTEYPAAISMGKKIIPFEMTPTDHKELNEVYSNLPEIISAEKADIVRNVILNSVKKLGINTIRSSAEKEYLRGLAYLKGICVEKNAEIGANKIFAAAENNVQEAARTAALMYRNGEGVSVSLSKAAYWQQKHLDIVEATYKHSPTPDNAKLLTRAYFELSDIYKQCTDFTSATETYFKFIEKEFDNKSENENNLEDLRAVALTNAGFLYTLLGDYFNARYKCFSIALEKRKKQYEQKPSMLLRITICELYCLIAKCCEKCQDTVGAKTNTLEIVKTLPTLEDIDTISVDEYPLVERILSCNNDLGHLYLKYFEYKTHEAFVCIGNSVLIAEKLISMSDSYSSCRQLVIALMNDGDQHATKKVENHLRVAEAAYNRAFTLISKMLEQYDQTFELKHDKATIIKKQAFLRKELGQTEFALLLYEDAIMHFHSLNSQLDSLSLRKDYYDCLTEAAITYAQSQEDDNCIEHLLEALELIEKNVKESELAVYKKDMAAVHELLSDIYKKQWDMDEAFNCAKKQCDLLRMVKNGTGRAGDIKLFANALKKAVSIANLAGEFEQSSELQTELTLLIKEYHILFS